MSEADRVTARRIAAQYLDSGDPLDWFEALYAHAEQNSSIIPWADLEPNPNLITWLNQHGGDLSGQALNVGCGLGDDAEELSRRGLATTAFDLSASAILWCRQRFPGSAVTYTVADLFAAPDSWQGAFDFVFEAYTLQILPASYRAEAIRRMATFVAPGGTLLVITRGKEPAELAEKMPWPVTKDELSFFEDQGLKAVTFEDFLDREVPPVRRFRATYRREAK